MTRVLTALASRPRDGEAICGDVGVVCSVGGRVLLCLADGLGHGERANDAARLACSYVEARADEPIESLLRGLDRELAASRGAAVSLVSIDAVAGRLRFAGVGNVDLRGLARERIAPPTMPGIVGQRLRTVRVWEYPVGEGDLICLVTDGITSRFELAPLAHLAVEEIAREVVARHRKSHDDACALVARLEAANG